MIVKGTCNLQCLKVLDKFHSLQRVEDPTLAQRKAEAEAMLNPNYSQKVKDKFIKTQLVKQKGIVPSEDRYGTIYNNGLVSKTLHSVSIGLKQENEWIGEE